MNQFFFNLSKRKKRDILSEVLVDKSPEGIVSKKELNAVNKIVEGSSLSGTPVIIKSKRAKTNAIASKKDAEPKIKATHYLLKEISENLDTAQIAIRSYVPKKFHSRVSKSHIVNQALAMLLQEFKLKGKDSRLMRTILQKL
jgi:hypothetical protein